MNETDDIAILREPTSLRTVCRVCCGPAFPQALGGTGSGGLSSRGNLGPPGSSGWISRLRPLL